MIWAEATFGLSLSNRSALSLSEQQDVEQECIALLTWRWASDLSSEDWRVGVKVWLLFLVDRGNLGDQTVKEFQQFVNGGTWTLANIGLTSTDIAALPVNGSNYHIFAGTHSIMGKGGGMFRSTDNGDTWTEQTQALQHLT